MSTTRPGRPPLDIVARTAIVALLVLAAGGALAAGPALPAPHQLAVVHLLSAGVAGGLAYLTARQWPAAAIVVAASMAYSARYMTGSSFGQQALQQGAHYLAQAQALALLVPLGALVGVAVHAARARG